MTARAARWSVFALAACTVLGWIPQARADGDEFDAGGGADPGGQRGTMSLAYQTLHSSGLLLQDGINNHGAITDTQSLRLSVDYLLDGGWELHAALPYISKRSLHDNGNHNPLNLVLPHPESQFLDDGRYHGGLQDLQLGVSRHLVRGRYRIEPHVVLTWPSHDYTFFANAAIGQHLRKLKFGADVTRQLADSNFYWSAGYDYEFTEKVMDIGIDKQHARLAAGYFFSPTWSGRVFATMRRSQGRDADFFSPANRDEYWYHHDQLSRHNYAIAGFGATWRINDRYALSGTVGRMVWGRTVHELKRAYELELSRSF
ncbi:hypothetical protein MQC88_05820 [Luteimonas sp. 50]|uniref:Uncharacterized protein n=1 Tax=Cognatiluteimonas sedimenti TaxID=2927791 RepID=A0ABT0A3D3_9GAMM|nr:hypothetical protein [Lysobacter sedimenti]MCJ0825479.1 hypothetical protein [Lysobacter sedimenti]